MNDTDLTALCQRIIRYVSTPNEGASLGGVIEWDYSPDMITLARDYLRLSAQVVDYEEMVEKATTIFFEGPERRLFRGTDPEIGRYWITQGGDPGRHPSAREAYAAMKGESS